MKPTKLTSAVSALAFIAILGAMSSAHAQAVNGDLILGFESSTSANVYEVDLGAASQFVGDSSALNFQLSTADLSSTTVGFGSSWASSTAVQWGLIGATSATNPTVFTSWNTFAAGPGAQSNPNAIATAVSGLYGDFNGTAAVTPGNTAALQTGSDQNTDPDSFAYLEKNGPNFKLGAGVDNSQLDYTSAGTAPAADAGVLDLYELASNGTNSTGAGTLLGEFTLASDGDLTFTPAAVPEPTSYVLGLVSVALFFVLRRRSALAA